MTKFLLLTDTTGKTHYINVGHITRVTFYSNAPSPHVYISFSDGKEGIYIPNADLDGIIEEIERVLSD